DLIADAFPNATLHSFLYGTTEAGMIGYSDLSSAPNEFRVFNEVCHLEIVDPVTHEVIRETSQPGRAVVTSFVRLAVPAIRLDTGDLAQWGDAPATPSPRFSLHGRVFPYIHDVAGIPFSEEDVWRLIGFLRPTIRMSRLEVVLANTFQEPSI